MLFPELFKLLQVPKNCHSLQLTWEADNFPQIIYRCNIIKDGKPSRALDYKIFELQPVVKIEPEPVTKPFDIVAYVDQLAERHKAESRKAERFYKRVSINQMEKLQRLRDDRYRHQFQHLMKYGEII